jgi:hypothetical protein
MVEDADAILGMPGPTNQISVRFRALALRTASMGID